MDTETKARLRPILENSKRGKPNTKKDDDFAVGCFRKWPKEYAEFRAEVGYSHALFSDQFERAQTAPTFSVDAAHVPRDHKATDREATGCRTALALVGRRPWRH
jgi:hypothetical protein